MLDDLDDTVSPQRFSPRYDPQRSYRGPEYPVGFKPSEQFAISMHSQPILPKVSPLAGIDERRIERVDGAPINWPRLPEPFQAPIDEKPRFSKRTWKILSWLTESETPISTPELCDRLGELMPGRSRRALSFMINSSCWVLAERNAAWNVHVGYWFGADLWNNPETYAERKRQAETFAAAMADSARQWTPEPGSLADRMLRYLRDHPGRMCRTSHLQEICGVLCHKTAHDNLERLLTAGLVRRERKKGTYWWFSAEQDAQ